MEELDDAVRGETPGYRGPRPVTSWMKPPKRKARSASPAPAAPPPAKDEAPAAAPTTPRKRRSPVLDGKPHVATTRLDDATYRRLRLYVTTLEQRTGERPTHQDIFTRALDEFLTKNGGD
jgi:hypothetical protein